MEEENKILSNETTPVNIENEPVSTEVVGETATTVVEETNTFTPPTSEPTKKDSRNTIILVLFIIIIILAAVALVLYLTKDKRKGGTSPTTTTSVKSDDLIIKDEDVMVVLNFKNVEAGKQYDYNIGNTKLTFILGEDGEDVSKVASLSLLVNDKKTNIDDYMWTNEISGEYVLSLLRNNRFIVYVTQGTTDIRQSEYTIIDYIKGEIIVDSLYELDEQHKGLVVDGIGVDKDSITINGTRITHGPAIVYDDDFKENKTYYCTTPYESIPENAVVEAEYKYSIKDDKIDLNNPEIVVTKTYKEFIDSEYSSTSEYCRGE